MFCRRVTKATQARFHERLCFLASGQNGRFLHFEFVTCGHQISPPPPHTELLCYRNLRLNRTSPVPRPWRVKCFTSSGQRLVEESLRGLAGAAVPSAHTAPIFFSVGAQDVVAAHVL